MSGTQKPIIKIPGAGEILRRSSSDERAPGEHRRLRQHELSKHATRPKAEGAGAFPAKVFFPLVEANEVTRNLRYTFRYKQPCCKA